MRFILFIMLIGLGCLFIFRREESLLSCVQLIYSKVIFKLN
jgi:hypothetical protein